MVKTQLVAAVSAICSVLWLGGAHVAEAVSFLDTFNPAPSGLWSNTRGNWTGGSGQYYSQAPSNSPLTYSDLPFDLTDFSITVDVTSASDGGIWFRTDGTPSNGYLLVFGGGGYGSGVRDGSAGTEIYFHRVESGSFSAPLSRVTGVFTPETSHTFRLDGVGAVFSVLVDNSPVTQLVDSSYASGRVGLYDFGTVSPKQVFTRVDLTGTVVPEPSALAVLGVGSLLGVRRGRR